MTMTSPLTFPYRKTGSGPGPGPGIGALLPKGQVWTLLGQVQRLDLGWAGRLRCALKLSVGTLTVVGNRDSLPLDAQPGEWLRIKARRAYEDPAEDLHVISAIRTTPDSKTAWVPTALYHRAAAMQRLRALLQALPADLQLFFLLCMSDAQVQRGYFWRAAAADHDVYPGGLFDQSVRAAERAYRTATASRELAAITALLYDLGKALDTRLQPDTPRLQQGLAPHALTARRVERALARLEPIYPQRVEALRGLLGGVPPVHLVPVAAMARRAVEDSWGARL
jgi:hypothetical protein